MGNVVYNGVHTIPTQQQPLQHLDGKVQSIYDLSTLYDKVKIKKTKLSTSLQQQLETLLSNDDRPNNIRFLALKILVESSYGPIFTEKKPAPVLLTKHIVMTNSQDEKSPIANKLMILFELCKELLTQPASEEKIIERLEYALRIVQNYAKLLHPNDELDLVNTLLELLKEIFQQHDKTFRPLNNPYTLILRILNVLAFTTTNYVVVFRITSGLYDFVWWDIRSKPETYKYKLSEEQFGAINKTLHSMAFYNLLRVSGFEYLTSWLSKRQDRQLQKRQQQKQAQQKSFLPRTGDHPQTEFESLLESTFLQCLFSELIYITLYPTHNLLSTNLEPFQSDMLKYLPKIIPSLSIKEKQYLLDIVKKLSENTSFKKQNFGFKLIKVIRDNLKTDADIPLETEIDHYLRERLEKHNFLDVGDFRTLHFLNDMVVRKKMP
uniref:Uncharacterized protein n=1 Tax=viral metagenome TaxID=1070528 RepID=A0A6C0D1L6_9ZZZZ